MTSTHLSCENNNVVMTAADCVATLSTLLAQDMAAVDKQIYRYMQSTYSSLIPQLATHIIQSGGKRLRPLLTLAITRLFQGNMQQSIKLATTVEFIHTATLLHDDVVDNSDMRRGAPSANSKWGAKPSILVGDYLFSRAFQLMVDVENLDVLRILSSAAAIIAEGEVLQLSITGNLEATIDNYIKAIEGKTATLFAAACESGAYVSPDATPAQVEAARLYGLNLGLAFQLTDDVLDYNGETDDLGKKTGNDFLEGKVTYPVLHAYQHATSSDEKKFWKRTIAQHEIDSGDFTHAINLMKKHTSLSATIEQAALYTQQAIEALDAFPDNELCSMLRILPQSILTRCT